MRRLAGALKEEQSLLVFGRGYNYATALEAALKVCLCVWGGGPRELGGACSVAQQRDLG